MNPAALQHRSLSDGLDVQVSDFFQIENGYLDINLMQGQTRKHILLTPLPSARVPQMRSSVSGGFIIQNDSDFSINIIIEALRLTELFTQTVITDWCSTEQHGWCLFRS